MDRSGNPAEDPTVNPEPPSEGFILLKDTVNLRDLTPFAEEVWWIRHPAFGGLAIVTQAIAIGVCGYGLAKLIEWFTGGLSDWMYWVLLILFTIMILSNFLCFLSANANARRIAGAKRTMAQIEREGLLRKDIDLTVEELGFCIKYTLDEKVKTAAIWCLFELAARVDFTRYERILLLIDGNVTLHWLGQFHEFKNTRFQAVFGNDNGTRYTVTYHYR